MKSTWLVASSVAVSFLSGQALEAAPLRIKQEVEELDIDMFYQFSATDDDAEVTIDVESDEAIGFLWIVAPDGHAVATIRSKDRLGLAEIELESAEPSVEEVEDLLLPSTQGPPAG